ncbi:hypothetical protein JL09_g4190 [Pichia kudriavzevii]|uniref:Uncharacterized protein n=1 Tax=Pichia kudriavzevii TaxID=4909 RepID=A0A099NXC8_PICKU|nr:hypothetical protein JL09_g4190 [Pichia kudriavzevii]
MSDDELSKEAKLEAARKKFEELKKNKKKKKGKKGKLATSETPEPETAPVVLEEKSPMVEGKGGVDEQGDVVDEGKGVVDEEKGIVDEEKGVVEELQETGESETHVSEKEEPLKSEKSVGAPSGEGDSSDPCQNESVENGNLPLKDANESSDTEGPETPGNKVEKGGDEVAPIVDNKASNDNDNGDQQEETKSDVSLSAIISNGQATQESTFLTSALQTTIAELQESNEKLHSEVGELKAENLELKLTKMDLEMELENVKHELKTQREEVLRLTRQLEGSKNNTHGQGSMDVYSLQNTSSFQNLTNFNIKNNSQDFMDIVDVKERLAQWKGWNMDMHGWRSIGMGPVIDA